MPEDIFYMSGYAKGTIVTDNFSLTPKLGRQVKYLKFLAVDFTRDLSIARVDGLLGLGPKREFDYLNDGNHRRSFVDVMKRSNVID